MRKIFLLLTLIITLALPAQNVFAGSAMMAYYDSGAATTPRYQNWTGTGWSGEGSATNVGGTIQWIVLKSAPNRNEYILSTLDADKDVNVQVWQNGVWGSVLEVTNNTYYATYRSFDIAYEELSGRALIVYDGDVDGDRYPRYRIWNGSGWSAQANALIVGTTISDIAWLAMASKPNSNEIILVTLSDIDYRIEAQVWNGFAWGNLTLLGYAPGITYQNFDVAYEQGTGRALVAWTNSTAAAVWYNVWDGVSWSTAQSAATVTDAGNTIQFIKLASEPGSNRILMGTLDSDSDINVKVWTGAAWGTRFEATESAEAAAKRDFDVAWENSTGAGMIAYGISADAPRYRTCSGSGCDTGSWSGEGSAQEADAGGGDPEWVRLVPDPNSNDIMLVHSDDDFSPDVGAQRWTGSWGDTTAETTSRNDYEAFALAYKQDITPPSITFVPPTDANDSVVGRDWSYVNVSVADTKSNVDSALLEWNGVNESMTKVGSGKSVSFYLNKSGLGEGSYTYRVWANDSSGNLNVSETRVVNVDKTPPSITFVPPTDANDSSVGRDWSYVNVSVADTKSSVDSALLEWNGANESMTKVGSGKSVSFYLNKSGLGEGSYTYRVWANDSIGNLNVSETRVVRVVTVDIIPPEWRSQGQSSSNPIEGAAVTLYAQGRDETSLQYAWLETNESGVFQNKSGVYGSPLYIGLSNTWAWSNFSWQNISVKDGTTVAWRIWYNDTSGNLNVTNTMSFTVSRYARLYLTDTATSAPFPDTSRLLSDTAPGSKATNWPGEFDSGGPGPADAGQWNPGIPVGNTSLATPIANPAQTTRNSASFGRGWLWDVDLTDYELAAGNYNFTLSITWAQGAAGDANRYDARLSIVTGSGGNFVYVKDLLTTRVTGSASLSGGQAGWRDNDAQIPQTASGTTQVVSFNITASEGHNFSSGERLLIELGFGDANDPTDRTPGLDYNFITTSVITPDIGFKKDKTPPSITFVPPTDANDSSVGRDWSYVNVSVTDTKSSVDSALLEWNGVNESMTKVGSGKSVSFYLNKSGLGEGSYTYRVWANDTSGNLNVSETRVVKVDKTPPSITFVPPTPSNEVINVSYTFINVTSNEDLSQALLEWNGTNESMNGSEKNWYKNKTGLANGNYTFRVWGNDTANNWNVSGMRWVYVSVPEAVPPQLNFIHPTPANNSFLSVSSVVINISHVEANPHTLILNWNGTNESYSYSGSYTNITKSVIQGVYTYYAWANDTWGNSNQTLPRILTIDTTNPSVTNVNANPSTLNSSQQTNISAIVTDNVKVDAVIFEIRYPNATKINYTVLPIYSDEFNDNALSKKWTWYNQPASWNELAGNLNITANPATDFWGNDNSGHLLHQNVTGNFEVVLKFSFTPTANFHKAGIMVRQDVNDWFDVGKEYDSTAGGIVISTDRDVAGTSADLNTTAWTGGSTTYLKINRTGNTFRSYYSSDGSTWNLHYSYTPASAYPGSIEVGIYIATGTSATQISANFDYIRLTNGGGNGDIFGDSNYTLFFRNTYQAGIYNVTIIANDTAGNVNSTEKTYFTVLDITPPEWRNQGAQNVSRALLQQGRPAKLYAQGRDATALDWAVLETNESGVWQNKSGVYGSPMDMNDSANTWVWSNFTWLNTSLTPGKNVFWRIWYNDTWGNLNVTATLNFTLVTWVSYNDSAYINKSDSFCNTSTVYMRGEGYPPSTTFTISYYDGINNEVGLSNIDSDANGNLSSNRSLGSGATGTWHSIVYPSGVAPPGNYTPNDPNIIADDAFTVLYCPPFPEFEHAALPLATSVLIYLRLRRKNGKA